MIVLLGWFVVVLLVVIALTLSLMFYEVGFPIWISTVLGTLTTYTLLMFLAILLHWALRSVVGINPCYLPSWKQPLWGTMAAIHSRIFSALKLFLPGDYVCNGLLRLFGMRIGTGTVIMGSVTDPEIISVGDDVHVGSGTILSGHIMSTMDRRVFRAPIVIEDGVRIGTNCTITPGVHIGPNAVVLPNTHVRTNQKLEGGRCYGGNPASDVPTL